MKNYFKCIFLISFLYLWYRALFNNEPRFSYTMPLYFTEDLILSKKSNFCHVSKADLFVQPINLDEELTVKILEKENPQLKKGGKWSPNDCVPKQKVAIIIPYRDRSHHLYILLKRLHPMLRKQKIDYKIFIINQVGAGKFNRGLVLNIGVKEAAKLAEFDCLILNDVDLVPENDANLYICDRPGTVRQISSAIDDTRYHVMFWNNAGGVVAISKKDYHKVNGHPNVYWGWGNEDDDFSARTLLSGLKLTRPPEHIGRFRMVQHLRGFRNTEAYWLFLSFRGRWRHDGISSLHSDTSVNSNITRLTKSTMELDSMYKLLSVDSNGLLYTNISVSIHHNPRRRSLHDQPHTWESWFWFLSFYGWI